MSSRVFNVIWETEWDWEQRVQPIWDDVHSGDSRGHKLAQKIVKEILYSLNNMHGLFMQVLSH